MTRPLRSTGVTQPRRYYEAACPWRRPRCFRSHGSTCAFADLGRPTPISSATLQTPHLRSWRGQTSWPDASSIRALTGLWVKGGERSASRQ